LAIISESRKATKYENQGSLNDDRELPVGSFRLPGSGLGGVSQPLLPYNPPTVFGTLMTLTLGSRGQGGRRSNGHGLLVSGAKPRAAGAFACRHLDRGARPTSPVAGAEPRPAEGRIPSGGLQLGGCRNPPGQRISCYLRRHRSARTLDRISSSRRLCVGRSPRDRSGRRHRHPGRYCWRHRGSARWSWGDPSELARGS
jgi:hypothetical protein